ncbi:CLUMA_CG000200, isoform A [Clunio marinus]|uniref:acid phosphatase n=1 Tax=Clunio marinus TaxID=568069 RepID=A0A1J1HGM2_9DIPT|nr:CLUMA_CG000200, isoform A [Clunio marinus]
MNRNSSLNLGFDGSKNKKRKELKVLFVSRRDSCRGPIAETIFQHLAEKYNLKHFNRFSWRANSAGLEKYNQGNLPEHFCLRVLAENNLETMHGCRQIRLFDFTRYDYILCMEPKQLASLVEMAPKDKKARLFMLGDFIKGRDKIICSPSDEDYNAFRICFERLYIACEEFYFHVNEKRFY